MFPFYKQLDQMDCGPSCLRMISKHFGKILTAQESRNYTNISKEGVSLLDLSNASEKLGFRTFGGKFELDQLAEAELPAILHWNAKHFVVLYKIRKGKYYIADPASGLNTYSREEFSENWSLTNQPDHGYALLVAPGQNFYHQEQGEKKGLGWAGLLEYVKGYRKLVVQLFLGLFVGSLLQLVTPFLTQAIVDVGISTRNIHFIYIILIAQVMLFAGTISLNFIRSWILLHISTRINISIITDFLIKLMKLPMSFFDTKMTGDILQRINDQRRIETFLTGTALNTVFSLVNLVVFGIAISIYNSRILLVFIISTLMYVGWIVIFMKRRRQLDYKNFEINAQNQNALLELVHGMQEIKLNNCEKRKRWNWEHIQALKFLYSIKSLALSQYQMVGAMTINQGKNILISFISAKAVIDGDLTLGGMMAVQYIAGQLNSPVEQFLAFMQGLQDARISLERLNEIHEIENEEPAGKEMVHELPDDKGIAITDLSFSYPGSPDDAIIKTISLHIPEGKTTAIVGLSGSGKSTLLKLLLRFYSPTAGKISVGNIRLDNIGHKVWRDQCGIVMQENYIFSDTILNNIALSADNPDMKAVYHALHLANLSDFIDQLPLGLNTKIGATGNGISQGQKQRILIARAIYKNPQYLFFDEATNSLDATNERIILDNLKPVLAGKTVVIVAHRLSTIVHADNIVVMDKGSIREQGNHTELIGRKGIYYELTKNQIDMGN